MDKPKTEIESQLLSITRQFLLDSGAERAARMISLESQLDHDLGIGSLERAELFRRVEKSFRIELPESLMIEARRLKDVVEAIKTARPPTVREKRETIPELEPVHIDFSKTKTLIEVLELYATNEPQRPHIYLQDEYSEETIIRYGDLYEKAKQVAQGLVKKGLKPGETVAIMLPTSAEFFYSFLGISLAGGIPVPIYPPFRADQIEEYSKREAFILKNAEVRFLITFKQAAALSRLLQSFIPSLLEVTTVNALMKIQTLLPRLDIESTDPALIQYTSGSTGNPKGVLLSHANLLANIKAYGEGINVKPTDVVVSWLPLYHDMGLIGAWMGSLYYGLPLTLFSPLFFLSHPERWLWAIHYHRATLSAAPNFAYELCAKKIDDKAIEGLDLSSWRLVVNGAEMIYPQTLRNFIKRFKKYGLKKEAIFPVYGLAENSVALTLPPLNRGPRIDKIERSSFEKDAKAVPIKPGEKVYYEFVSCGSALDKHDVRVVDDKNNLVEERVVGNIQFKGPSSMQGYYRNPEATLATYHDGWWETGDLGYLADNELFITGRKKDLIIKAGRNYYPAEIEEVIGLVTGVRAGSVAVFGITDQKSGTEKLIVVAETKEDNKKSHPKIKQDIMDKVVLHWGISPDDVILVPPHTVPKTSSGKLRRSSCKEAYLSKKLGRIAHSPKWQIVRLFIQSITKKLERGASRFIKMIFALYLLIVLFFTLLPTWLLVIILPRKKAAAVFHFWARWSFRLGLCSVTVKGRENMSDEPMIYVSNHTSYMDIPLLAGTLPADIDLIGKKELLKNFIAKSFIKQLDLTTVDRLDFSKSHSDAKRIEEKLKQGRSVLIFPEGTFSYATGVRPFKLGAFKIAVETGLPVCPVAISGARKILRAKDVLPRPGSLRVTICKPLVPKNKEWETMMQLRRQSRALIAKHSGEQMIDLVTAALPIKD